MTEDVADQLDVLVRKRSDGRISVADYRRLRAPLLDRLVAGATGGLDESSAITRPRGVGRALEPVQSRAVSDLETVFAPRSRVGLWSVCVFGAISIAAVGAKVWSPSPGVTEGEIELVQVTSMRVSDEPSRDARPASRGTADGKSGERESKRGASTKGDGGAKAFGESTASGVSGGRSLLTQKYRACESVRPGTAPIVCEDRLSGGAAGPRLIVVSPRLALGVSARAISQSQFRAFCEKTGRSFPRQPWEDDDPAVVNVTWDEANDYVRWLSRESGHRYRLPTESEWLEAARTLGVRNGFTAGKVREWVEDEWIAEPGSAPDPEQRVVVGTSYADDGASLLSARRNRLGTMRDALTGFRVVREL
jgi:hypothetical protein